MTTLWPTGCMMLALTMADVQGELFKADGEVVSSGRPAGATGKYELAAYPKAILRPPAVVAEQQQQWRGRGAQAEAGRSSAA